VTSFVITVKNILLVLQERGFLDQLHANTKLNSLPGVFKRFQFCCC